MERAAHAVEADGPGGRHGERQQQREFSGTAMPPLEAHVREHADGRRHASAQPRERDVHAHVVLRAPDGGKVVVAEIPAKISTCLSRTEQLCSASDDCRQRADSDLVWIAAG